MQTVAIIGNMFEQITTQRNISDELQKESLPLVTRAARQNESTPLNFSWAHPVEEEPMKNQSFTVILPGPSFHYG
jgi:hypothetical protein